MNLQGGPVTIEDSEFDGGAGTWIRASYDADNLTVRRCDFSGMANAVEFGTRTSCGFFGPVYPESLDASGTWDDNRWHDGARAGELLPAP